MRMLRGMLATEAESLSTIGRQTSDSTVALERYAQCQQITQPWTIASDFDAVCRCNALRWKKQRHLYLPWLVVGLAEGNHWVQH